MITKEEFNQWVELDDKIRNHTWNDINLQEIPTIETKRYYEDEQNSFEISRKQLIRQIIQSGVEEL